MKIALGVTGGIAAYKAAEIARRLQDRNIRVQVIMTTAAQEFVRPLTFAALTGEKVITEMFSQRDSNSTLDSSVEHIGVAQSIDALLVAPATAASWPKIEATDLGTRCLGSRARACSAMARDFTMAA